MTENTKLLKVYNSLYDELSIELNRFNKKVSKEEKATNPLLLKTNKSYTEADVKIMFFGQETNVWGDEKNGVFLGEVEPFIDLYNDFYLKGGCFSYGGQFWNGINRFKELLQNEMPHKKIGYMWNNVGKIGKCGKGYSAGINEIAFEKFNVFSKEIEILKPDFLVFFSGPKYDGLIRKHIGEFSIHDFKSFTPRQLCGLDFADFPKSYRTYHPNYLWRNKINNYLTPIVKDIKRSVN